MGRFKLAAAGTRIAAMGALLAISAPTGAGAATGDYVRAGYYTVANGTTGFSNTSQYDWALVATGGLGLYTNSQTISGDGARDALGVSNSGNYRAIFATTSNSEATVAAQNRGNGSAVYAQNSSSTATGAALIARAAAKGRGARFAGGAAQFQLEPSTASTHPANGLLGDFFLDSQGRLWFCKGGAVWKQLA